MKILTIGGVVQDITLHTKAGVLVKNEKDLTRQKLVGFELGAKINIKQADFNFGGGAANTAVNLAKLGQQVSVLACVGQDALGQEIVKNLKAQQIKTNLVQQSAKHSGFSCVVNSQNLHEEHTLFTYRGANEDLVVDLDKLINKKIKPEYDLIYISALSGAGAKSSLAKIFKYKTKYAATKIVWNPGNEQIKMGLAGLKPYLKQTDIFIVNKDEAIEICLSLGDKNVNPRYLLKKLAENCPGIIIITDGENGAYAQVGKKVFYEHSCHVKIKDTTGVGDAFGSTLVWALNYTNNNMARSLQLAIKNACSVLQQVGAQHGLLTRSQLLGG